ncbi:hypothetical protein HF086_011654 [Spodoptera exigua]|uniref:Cytochrome p450 n=1 Tax=Spodoptera exigua TaxID=7107 RepID=A0A922MSL8_SPOEX|nr:hypothetical protein HF086_011654 [Spodoptera exigua]
MTSLVDETEVPSYNTRLIFYPLLLLASSIWILYRWQQKSRMYKFAEKIPGPAIVPFVGNALIVLRKKPSELVKLALEYGERFGNVVRVWMGSNLIVFLTDPNDVEIILNSQVHIDKATEYKFFKPWLGEGLLISTGEKWRSHRKMIAPTFHINILKSFVGVFNQNGKNVVEKMRPEMGKEFDVHDYMSGVTVDILLETAMGITRKTQDESGFDYAMAVMKMCDIIHQRHYKLWLRFDSIFNLSPFFKQQKKLLDIIHGLTNKVIKSKKETYLENKAKGFVPPTLEELTRTPDDNVLANNDKTLSEDVFKGYRDDLDFNDENDIGEKKRLAFLDLMIESSQNGTNNISDHEIKEEVDTIMFEGHDTTAAGSSFVLCLLGVHKHIQDRVYNELYEIFGDSDRPATFADTLQMKYLERVILESLRMYPPVPIIARKLNRDVKIGAKWRSHRKMIAPTFHINILKSFVDVFNQNSKSVVEKMRSEIGKTFDVHDHMSGVTVDILLETAMGITKKTQDQSSFDYAMAVMKMCDIIHQRHYKFWLRLDSIFKFHPLYKTQQKLLDIIHGLTNKLKKKIYQENKAKGIIPPSLQELTDGRALNNDTVLANNAKTLSDTVFKGYRDDLDFNDENDVGEKKRLAFLDLMIESAQNGTNQISDHEIKEEVDTIMFEGHDTTAAGSSFVLCLLGLHQDVQAKVYDELYQIFGDSDRLATFNDTLQMKYLERVILETLRMYPPVPIIARELKNDAKIGRKYALLKLKILLSTILRNYKTISDIPEEDFQLKGDIILKRSDGFRIRIEPRVRVPSNAA